MALPLVLVPGLNCTSRLFSRQIEGLSAERAVMVACHRLDDSLDGMAERLLAEAPPRFVLGGLSMGGYVAFEVMRRAAGRVAGLVLMDTTARADTPEARERRERQIALARGGRFADIPDLQIPLLLGEAARTDARIVAAVHAMAAETGADAFIRQQTAILGRPDSRPHLSAITCPTLVLVGEADAITPPALAREIADGIAGAALSVVAGAGHLSTLEAPEAVGAALSGFLKDLRS